MQGGFLGESPHALTNGRAGPGLGPGPGANVSGLWAFLLAQPKYFMLLEN